MTDTDAILTIVIDDERTFMVMGDQETNTIYLRTADEALVWFAEALTAWHFGPVAPVIGQIWFDHDLGDGDDATKVAKFLLAMSGANPGAAMLHSVEILVHSQNPVGAKNLADIMKPLRARVVPLPDLAG